MHDYDDLLRYSFKRGSHDGAAIVVRRVKVRGYNFGGHIYGAHCWSGCPELAAR